MFLGNKSNQKALTMVEGLIGNKEYIILIIKLIFFFLGISVFAFCVFIFVCSGPKAELTQHCCYCSDYCWECDVWHRVSE